MKIFNCYNKYLVKFDEYKFWIIIDFRLYEYNLIKVIWMDKNSLDCKNKNKGWLYFIVDYLCYRCLR